jgi:Microtubule-binding stalk of dynein motor
MGNVDAFLKSLVTFDKENIPIACVDKVSKEDAQDDRREHVRSESVTRENVRGEN